MEFVSPEFAIIERAYDDFPRKVVNAMMEELARRFTGSVLMDTDNSKFGRVSRTLIITESVHDERKTIRLTLTFARIPEEYGKKGLYINWETEDGSIKDEEYVGFYQDGVHPLSDLITILEDYTPTDWIYNRMETEFESMRESLSA